jgi:hypothetical protein
MEGALGACDTDFLDQYLRVVVNIDILRRLFFA